MLGNNCYAVTPAANFQNGTLWSIDQIDLESDFDIEFFMNYGSNDANGADGMVFVLQQIGTGALGVNGSGMGFQGFNTSFGIEFDTYTNSADPTTGQNMNDPTFDHVAFLKNGVVNHATANNLAGPVQASATGINIEDGQDHLIRITWNPSTMLVQLFFDCDLRLSATVDLLGTIFTTNPVVYFGFTGSTGGFNNLQSICLQENLIPSPESVSICPGESIQLNAGGDSEGTFSWSPATDLDDATIQTPTASPTSTTIYTATTFNQCGIPVTQDFEVIVLPSPTVEAGPDDVFCENDTYQLQGNVANIMAYQWTTIDGTIDSGSNVLNTFVSAPGTYTLEGISPNGCVLTDEVVITETPLPTVELGTDLLVCENEETTITLTSTYDEVLWSTNETTQSITVGAGNYSVTVTTSNCSSSDNIVVNEEILPLIDLGNDVTICETTELTLDAGVVVLWNDGSSSQTLDIFSSGEYSATFESNGCSVTDVIDITIDQVPVFSLGPDQFICEGELATLTAPQNATWSTGEFAVSISVSQLDEYWATVQQGTCSYTDEIEVMGEIPPVVDLGFDRILCNNTDLVISALDENIATYLWSTGSTNDKIYPSETGEYSVIVENVCGLAYDTVMVTFEECDYFIYAPNSFTPDQDGINDVWLVSTFRIDSYEIFIYDRWGNTVFHSIDPKEAWLGEFKNGEYYNQSGVYNFVIKYTADTIDAQYLRGHITLLR
jgi:gliding motility-associated-like protein